MFVLNRLLWIALAVVFVLIIGKGTSEAIGEGGGWWLTSGDLCATQAGCNSNR